MSKKQIYWREYKDKNSTGENSVVLTLEEMLVEAELSCKEYQDGDIPIFEPILMTKEEYEKLPEFDGF